MGVRPTRLRRSLRRRRGLIGALFVVCLFVLALALYAGKDPESRSPGVAGSTGPSLAGSSGLAASPRPANASPSPSGAEGLQADLGKLPLSPLPGQRSRVNPGEYPPTAVRMLVKSDATILRLGYLLKGGHPDKYYRALLDSPVSFQVVAHGPGLVAKIGAQAGPTATEISCTISINGGPPVTHVAKGPYRFVVCLG